MKTKNKQCSCTLIEGKFLRSPDGATAVHWSCSNAECKRTFVPAAMFDTAMHCARHLCQQVAAEAAHSVRDPELREVAENKIFEYAIKALENKVFPTEPKK
jgi:hypothetical protein